MSEKYCGKSMKSMTEEEMRNIYGAHSEEQPNSVSATLIISFVGSYLASAAFKCGKDNKGS